MTTRTWGRETGMREGHRPQWLPGGPQLWAGLPFGSSQASGTILLAQQGVSTTSHAAKPIC